MARSTSSRGQYTWSADGHSTVVICSMVAARNHGNSAKATRNSSLPSGSHHPCRETWVTSATEVADPGIADLVLMAADGILRLGDLPRREPDDDADFRDAALNAA